MTMIKPLVSVLVAVSLSACSELESSEPHVAWDEAAKKMYMELSVVGPIPTAAEVGIPIYPGSKLTAPVVSVLEDRSLCFLSLGVNDAPSKVRDFYVKEVENDFRGMDVGHIYIFSHRKDDDVSIHVVKEGAKSGYTTNIVMKFRALKGYRCADPASEATAGDV